VIVAMRRTLLSCTSLARNGMIGLGAALMFNRARLWQRLAAPACGLGIPRSQSPGNRGTDDSIDACSSFRCGGGAAVRTRLRAARSEERLRSDVQDLQVQADRLRALLFAEPQILISWLRATIVRKSARHLARDGADSSHYQPQRILAFGTWLPPEPALQNGSRGRRRCATPVRVFCSI